MRRLGYILVGLMVLLLAQPLAASADSYNFSWQGYKSVSFKVDGKTYNSGTAEAYSNNSSGNWIGYCVDPLHTFSNPVTPVDTYGNWMQAAWLMENYAVGLNDPGANYNDSNTKFQIQALQVAIWELTMDPSTSYGYGDFSRDRFKFYDSTVAWLASQMLANLNQAIRDGLTLSDRFTWSLFAKEGGQTILAATVNTTPPVSSTPEPGTMLLFGSAAGLMGIFRRRMRRSN